VTRDYTFAPSPLLFFSHACLGLSCQEMRALVGIRWRLRDLDGRAKVKLAGCIRLFSLLPFFSFFPGIPLKAALPAEILCCQLNAVAAEQQNGFFFLFSLFPLVGGVGARYLHVRNEGRRKA